ncbi:hypothetical protein LCGC14_2698890, partial [marine sediment metagenome]
MSDISLWRRFKRILGLATCPDLEQQVKKAREEKEEAMQQLEKSNVEKKASFETLGIASAKANETMQMSGQD